MHAIDFLLKEHNKVRKNLNAIANESHRYLTKKKLFKSLSEDLIRHETMEQKVWYQNFKNSRKLRSEVKHLLTEEKHAEKAIKKLKSIQNEEKWEEEFFKFKKAVEHHAHEEETKLFPNVKEILDQSELQAIGKEMYIFKKRYKKEEEN